MYYNFYTEIPTNFLQLQYTINFTLFNLTAIDSWIYWLHASDVYKANQKTVQLPIHCWWHEYKIWSKQFLEQRHWNSSCLIDANKLSMCQLHTSIRLNVLSKKKINPQQLNQSSKKTMKKPHLIHSLQSQANDFMWLATVILSVYIAVWFC